MPDPHRFHQFKLGFRSSGRIVVTALLTMLLSVHASIATAQTPREATSPGSEADSQQRSIDGNPLDEGLPAYLTREHPVWRAFAPKWVAAPCPYPSSAKYNRERVDCGYVLVPENRRNPDSRLIRLSVARVQSTEASPAAGITVFLNGGPGNPIVRAGPRFSRADTPWMRRVTEVSDMVLLDQRGTGYSEGFFCRGLDRAALSPTDPQSEQSIAYLVGEYRRCLDEGVQRGVDVTAYTTWDNAMDVRDVREALGLKQWNVFGGSYGTELGQMVLRIDAAGTRAAVLDSVVAPPPLSWGGTAFGMRNALEALNAACVEHGACASRFGDLAKLAENAVDAYRDKPLVLGDLPSEVVPSRELVLNHRVVSSGFFSALYSRQLYPAMPALMEAVAARDEVALRATATILADANDLEWGSGMGVVTACSGFGPVSAARAEEVRTSAPFWTEALANSGTYDDLCEPLGLLEPDPLHTFLESDVPVLLAAGSVDPITPPAYAEYVHTGLTNSFLIEVPFTGHFATAPGCPAGILADFLRSPTQAPDASCLDDMDGVEFVTQYKPTRAVYDLYQTVEEGRYSALIVPGMAILALLTALLAYPVAWVGRKLDRQRSEHANPRRLAWFAAFLMLGGATALGLAAMQTFSRSVALLALGLIGPTVWVTPLIVLGVLIALLALVAAIRKRSDAGTVAGVSVVLGSGIALSVSLTLLGLLF